MRAAKAPGRAAPVRSCMICRRRGPKRELHRYVRTTGEPTDFLFDEKKRLPGRGYYLCDRDQCRDRFARLNRPAKRTQGGI